MLLPKLKFNDVGVRECEFVPEVRALEMQTAFNAERSLSDTLNELKSAL